MYIILLFLNDIDILFERSFITIFRIIRTKFIIFHLLQEKESQCMFGLVLYSLDRLFHAVERHAKATGEWQWLV